MALKEIAITRNNVSLVFPPAEVTKGSSKGSVVLRPKPVTNRDEMNNLINWMGENDAFQCLNAYIRSNALGWAQEAEEEACLEKVKDDKGNEKIVKIDEEKYIQSFVTLAQEFSARGETIKQLQERIDEKLAELSDLTESTADDAPIKMLEVAKELKRLQSAKASKKRKRQDDDDENGKE